MLARLRRWWAARQTNRSPWDVGEIDLLRRFERGLNLTRPPGRRSLIRPEDERETE